MSDRGRSLAQLARGLRPFLVAVLAVTLVIVVVLGLRVQTVLKLLQDEPTDNFHWNFTQLELDLVRLTEEMRLAQALHQTSFDELRKRYDLFYSRAQNAMAGEGYVIEGFETISWDMAYMLNGYLKRTTPLIDGADSDLAANLAPLTVDAEAVRVKLRQLSIKLLEGLAVQNDTRRAEFSLLFDRLTRALLAAAVLLMAFMAVVLWLSADAIRQARQRERIGQRLIATVDSALDAIIAIDGSGTIIQYNRSAEQIFGFTAAEAIGRDLASMIVPEKMRAAHTAGMERMHRTGTFTLVNKGRFQISALAKSGKEFPVELAISQAQGEDGPIYIAFLRDITDRLAAEAELTTARDEALAAERAKTNFLAVMSHEMRTPLNGVIASLEIAAEKASDPGQARFIALAQDSAAQLLRQANDVLDIARLEAGGLKLTQADFDPAAHLAGLVEAIRPLCDQKRIGLELSVIGAIPRLYGDKFRLGQIVQNFLSNAVKFVETGQITVEAEVGETHGDERMLEIRVIDTGPGIAEDDQERIFEDFVMLDPTFGRSGGGAGLGLAISRRLAEAIGGEVGVESAPGEGSCFWLRVSLPLAKEAEAAPSPRSAPAELARRDILVVEDNATNRAVLEEMLGRLGQNVVLAHDGQQGADAARARRFDVILMDVSMPVMDGIAATRLIRAGGASAGARILAVTAHSLPADLERFRAAGMDDVLVKPISLADLTAALGDGPAVAPEWPQGLVNHDRLVELRLALGDEGADRIKARFLADCEALSRRLEAILAAPADGETLAAICHEAAGLASVMGAVRLREHFATGEMLCREGQVDEARDLMASQTAALWSATRAALDKV